MRSAGQGFRIKAEVIRRKLMDSSAFQRLHLHCTQALIAQTNQIAACNRHHSLVQPLCHCLLGAMDPVHSNDIVLTHDLIAQLIGVRSASVTAATNKLHEAGLILYRPGHITVLDREGLGRRACECYN